MGNALRKTKDLVVMILWTCCFCLVRWARTESVTRRSRISSFWQLFISPCRPVSFCSVSTLDPQKIVQQAEPFCPVTSTESPVFDSSILVMLSGLAPGLAATAPDFLVSASKVVAGDFPPAACLLVPDAPDAMLFWWDVSASSNFLVCCFWKA